jgi:hypothetical protein
MHPGIHDAAYLAFPNTYLFLGSVIIRKSALKNIDRHQDLDLVDHSTFGQKYSQKQCFMAISTVWRKGPGFACHAVRTLSVGRGS